MEDSWEVENHKERVVKAFESKLGNGRVHLEGTLLRLVFDLRKQDEFAQFDEIGQQLMKHRMLYDTSPADENDAICTICIPIGGEKQEITLNILETIAANLTVGVLHSETHHPITYRDREYALVDATGVPWDRVSHSIYGTDTLEPRGRGAIDEGRRNKEEFAVGSVLHTGDPSGAVNEWLSHQKRIEEKDGKPLRTAIPEEWTKGHVDRVTSNDGLKRIFGGRS